MWLFLNEGTFTLASSVQEAPVIFKIKRPTESQQNGLIYRSMNFVEPNFTFKTSINM